MEIKYYGNSCFLFKNKKGVKLLTNPFDKEAKVNLKNINPDIVITSGDTESGGKDSYYLINTPGEYEIKDMFIYGYSSLANKAKSDLFIISSDSINVAFIDKSVSTLSDYITDEMGVVNVLFVSLDENVGMKINKIVDIASEIDPQILVPMDYDQESLDSLKKSIGIQQIENDTTLKINAEDFLGEDLPMRLFLLEKNK